MVDYEEELTEEILIGNKIRMGTEKDAASASDLRIIEQTSYPTKTGTIDEGSITDGEGTILQEWRTYITNDNGVP